VNWGSALVAVGVIVGLTSTMLMMYYAMTRTLFAMARDGLMPRFFSRVDAKTHVPAHTTILCGIVMASIAGLVSLGDLAPLVSVAALTDYAIVCLGVVVLRLAKSDLPQPFRAPGGLIFPILGVLACGALIGFLPVVTLMQFLFWLAIGVAAYFGYAARRMSSTETEA
jgi:APA family basic amino acid/polyamine antiporter